MAVGPHQHERTSVKGRGGRMIDPVHPQRYAAARSRALDGLARHVGEFQEDEARAEQVESRMFGSEPNVRSSRAGKCGRRVAVGVVLRLWRAVRYHDRRRMIDVSEMYAYRVP